MQVHIECFRDVARYFSRLGAACCGDSLRLLERLPDSSVNLVVTNPPLTLLRRKGFVDLAQHEYTDWLASFAWLVRRKLRDDGSFVLVLPGGYERGVPVRSLHPFRVPIRLCDELGFFLADWLNWHDPLKPAHQAWVYKHKIRPRDSVSQVYWFSKLKWPKVTGENLAAEHRGRLKTERRDAAASSDSSGTRGWWTSRGDHPYFVRESAAAYGSDEGAVAFGDTAPVTETRASVVRGRGSGAPSNLLSISGAEASEIYLRGCKVVGAPLRVKRFPSALPRRFIEGLTEPGDLVVDVFGGSNATGQVAEHLGRRWLSFEPRLEQVAMSVFRFMPDHCSDDELRRRYAQILSGDRLHVAELWTPPQQSQ